VITNYHQHSSFSDGQDTLEQSALAAVDAGMAAVGFSDHAPVPFPTDWTMPLARLGEYRAEAERLATVLEGRIEVTAGLEMDYLPDSAAIAFQNRHVLPVGWDTVIGAIHYLGREANGEWWPMDLDRPTFERGLSQIYGGEIRRLCDAYFATVRDMARDGRFRIVAHLDYTKRFNAQSRYYSDESAWYRGMVQETLRAIAAAGMILEVNSGGWRGSARSAYPAPFALRQAARMGIPITLSSDSHRPCDVDAGLARAADLARVAGYTAVMRRLGGRWKSIPLTKDADDEARGRVLARRRACRGGPALTPLQMP
jgi:histidinol-phosphatase (PHP family)